MKILTGTYKNRNFYKPAEARPTQNILRKAVFDIFGQDLEGVNFLDIYAGSGAMGLEALSNGAKFVTFLEKEPKTARLIEENIKLLDPELGRDRYSVLNGDAFATIKLLARQERKFDIVFIDPPFGLELAKKTLKTMMSHDILTPHSYVVVQYDKFESMPEVEEDFKQIKHQKYGTSFLTIYERTSL